MVYSDVVNMGLILPYKEKYNKKDYEKLVDYGYTKKVARFICVCSAIYHDVKYSNYFNSKKLRYECGLI